ncbi:MAG: HdeD family acid-resistance protein [Robiginitalea sp.]|nr:HdeD family acid-resistance protein [Robiginitalea sp.]
MENAISKIGETLKYWWVGVLLGILFLLLGFWVLQSPVESFVTFAIYFAIIYIVSGIGAIAFSISNRESLDGWGWQLAGGILELILGIALLANPGASMIVLAFFVGFWLLFRGFSAISISFELKRDGVKNWGWILFSGVLTTILAFMVLVNPLYAVSTLSIFVGLALVMAGIAQIVIGFQIRKVSKKVKEAI